MYEKLLNIETWKNLMQLNDTKSIVQCILEILKSGEKIIDFLKSRQTI